MVGMNFLLNEIASTPLWLWLVFISLIFTLLFLDLGFFNKGQNEISISKSFKMSGFYIAIGLLFGVFVWWQLGQESAILYLTGFTIEKTLAIDNVFVIAMIFAYFNIPQKYQHRVLFYGILGVLILRAIMIGFGAYIVSNFHWVLYVFAVFLIFTGVKMLMPNGHSVKIEDNFILKLLNKTIKISPNLEGNKFFVKKPDESGKIINYATPLFVALIMIEIADLVFAIDSIPAIFAITTDPFIVFTSNIFAILGLRALYFALAAMIEKFAYLKYALAVLLMFIGSKIFITDMFNIGKFPPLLSLAISISILAIGILYSFYKSKKAVNI
jgi:tellurite resistance protein TerC